MAEQVEDIDFEEVEEVDEVEEYDKLPDSTKDSIAKIQGKKASLKTTKRAPTYLVRH